MLNLRYSVAFDSGARGIVEEPPSVWTDFKAGRLLRLDESLLTFTI